MQDRFVYVFSAEDRDKLTDRGYSLLKSDDRQCVYIFQIRPDMQFYEDDISYVLSSTLTF